MLLCTLCICSRGHYKIDIVQSSSEYLPQALKSTRYLSLNHRTKYKRTGHLWKYKVMLSRLCFRVFQSITAYKIDSEHTPDYTKLFPVCKYEILQVTVNKVDALSSF